jgi:hypothetical protein
MSVVEPASTAWWCEYLANGANPQEADELFQAQFKTLHPRYERVVFPPPLFDNGFLRHTATLAVELLDVLISIPNRIFKGDLGRWLQFQGVATSEAKFLLQLCTPRFLAMATEFARPDCLLTNKGVKIVEFNVAPPIGGIAICDRVREEFRLTAYHKLIQSHGIECSAPSTGARWAETIRRLARFSATQDSPLFFEALADPSELAETIPQHADFVRIIEGAGFEHAVGLIGDLDVRSDAVWFKDKRVHVVFTAFTYSELRRFRVPEKLVLQLANADDRQQVDFICPPTHVLFDNKINLELLTSPTYRHYFSTSELDLIDAHLLPTRRLSTETFDDAMRDRLGYVLKPTREFGGAGVSVGSNENSESWEAKLKQALAGPDLFILQRVAPTLWRHDSTRGVDPQLFCLGPMVFGHQYAGALVRGVAERTDIPIINSAMGAAIGAAMSCAQPLAPAASTNSINARAIDRH